MYLGGDMIIVMLVFLGVSGGTLMLGFWKASLVFAGLAILKAFFIWMDGGFQKCPKCGSRWTEQISDEVPDASMGSARMHSWVGQKCWNFRCRKTSTLRGIEVICKDENGQILD
jgi:hypothetical protein